MNEKTVVKGTYPLLIIGVIIFSIVGYFTKDISYVVGFVLGFVINALIFQVIIKMCDAILNLGSSTAMIVILQVVKLVIYAVGFIAAVKSQYIHIVGVFFGYMVTKLSIYMEGIKHKGGDV